MIPLQLVAIVEGHGEVEAVPVLLRRYAERAGWPGGLRVQSLRGPASKLVREGELERYVELAARKLGGPGGILVLLDSDAACPARLGPSLLSRARRARSDLPISVVLAQREFEAWFLGAANSLAGFRGLPFDLKPHPSPESVSGCKEWIRKHWPRGRSYDEVEDQPALTQHLDLEAARIACASFDKCHREIDWLLRQVAQRTPGFAA